MEERRTWKLWVSLLEEEGLGICEQLGLWATELISCCARLFKEVK